MSDTPLVPPAGGTSPLRSDRAHVLVVQAMLLCSILTSLSGAFAHVNRARAIGEILDGSALSDADLVSADDLVQRVAAIGLGVLVLTIVAWILWFHRAYRNVGVLAGRRLVYSSKWAVGAWFVPFLNLVRPKEITNDLFSAVADEPRDEPVPALVHVWWGLLIVATIITRLLRFQDSDSLESFRTEDYVAVVSQAFDVAAAIAAILVVRELTRRQLARRRAVEAVATP